MGVQLRRLGSRSQTQVLALTNNRENEWIAGRGSHCHIITRSNYASRRHFSIIYRSKKFFVCDHGSSNGTYVNDEKINPLEEYPLPLDSTISVGVPSVFQNESDCIAFVFELSEGSRRDDNVEASGATSSGQDRRQDFIPNVESGEGSSLSDQTRLQLGSRRSFKVDPESSTSQPLPVNETVGFTKVAEIKIERVENLENSSPLCDNVPCGSENRSEQVNTENSGLLHYHAFEDYGIRVKDEIEENGYGIHYDNVPLKVEETEADLFEPEGLVHMENDYYAPMEVDEPEIRNSQLSYSVTEELIEISDSDDDLPNAVKTEPGADNSALLRHDNEEDDDLDDDVIFLDNVVKSNKENYPPAKEVKSEIDDFTETDKKWIDRLFKTKEECDSFIQSQRECNEVFSEEKENCSNDDWLELVTDCADKIEQILLLESDKADQREQKEPGDVEMSCAHLEQNQLNDDLDANNDHSEIIGVVTLLQEPGIDAVPKLTQDEVCKEKEIPKRDFFVGKSYTEKPTKKIKLFDPLEDDEDDGFAPFRKKPRLDFKIPKIQRKAETKPSAETKMIKNIDRAASQYFQHRGTSKTKRRKRKISATIPNAEKEKIKNERKRKLKELSMRDTANQEKKDRRTGEKAPKILAPLKIKITRKNRSQFLCEGVMNPKDQEIDMNKGLSKKTGEETGNKISRSGRRNSEDVVEGRYNAADGSDSTQERVKVNRCTEEPRAVFKENLLPNEMATDQGQNKQESVNVIVREEEKGVLKSCLRKFGYFFLKTNRPIVSKKSVRFTNTQNIRYYETENRISRKTSTVSSTSVQTENALPQFGSVIYDICSWNTIWLEECKRVPADDLPPPFHNKMLKSIQKKFSSHEDYMKSFIPLLLLEMWHTVSEKWRTCDDSSFCRFPAVCRNYADSPPGLHENLGLIKCESVSDDSNNISAIVRVGDLVIIQLSKPSNRTGGKPLPAGCTKKMVYRIFGYVEKKTVQNVDRKDLDQSLAAKCSKSTTNLSVMALEISVKRRPELTIQPEETLQITLIHHISPFLVHCRAVCSLYKSPLCQAILTPNRPDMTFSNALKKENLIFTGPLDDSQQELILKLVSSCSNREYSLLGVQGGPGTGKTYIIIAFILQLLYTKHWKGSKRPKILYCSHNNAVVDDLALKLKNYRQTLSPKERYKLVRYGNINAMKPAVRDISTYQLALQNEYYGIVAKKIKYLEDKIKVLAAELESNQPCSRQDVEKKSAKLHEYVKEREMVKNSRPVNCGLKPSVAGESIIMENADVICTTCSSSGTSKMVEVYERIKAKSPNQKIICIVDEAMQSKESETIVPLQLGVTHLILFGDPQQLRPQMRNEVAQSLGINQSLFWRILSTFDKINRSMSPVYHLKTQYRMNSSISSFPNKIFYQNCLQNGNQSQPPSPIMEEFLMLIDSGASDASGKECELRLQSIAENIMKAVVMLMNKEGANYSIALITCRVDEAKSLKTKLSQRLSESALSSIEVGSIENVQGREFDYVLFIFDVNMNCAFRANVAMTRARYSLMILTTHPTYKNNKLLSKLAEEASGRNAFFYVNDEMGSQALSRIITKYST